MPLINFVLALLATCAITGLVYACAARLRLIDHPSGRSSHTTPTPRGGGLGFGLVWLVGLACALLGPTYALATHPTHGAAPWALFVGSLVVMVLGFIDDRHPLSARLRLVVQSLVAMGCVATLALSFHAPATANLPWAHGFIGLAALGLIVLVWGINAANFVDGLDGYLASQCLLAVLALWALAHLQPLAWGVPLVAQGAPLLAACLLGFLLWNWPQAKLFMGDVGSTTLGFVLAYWALWQQQLQANALWVYGILMGVVVVDTTATLLVRAARGQSLWQAHRSHAYQHAAQRHRSHGVVTITAMLVQGFWLVPIAFCVATQTLPGYWGLALAYAPLLLLCWRYQAGR